MSGETLTFGEQLAQSSTLNNALDAALQEVESYRGKITDIRPPMEERKESYEAALARIAKARGRGLLYPYVGSGLGNGALVELLDGSVKWDLISGIGVHFFGHSDPDLIRTAMHAGITDTVKHGNLQTGNEPFTFSDTLLKAAGKSSRLKHCFLSTSGAMANENALKLAFQKHAPACRVIAFADCFMGRSIVMSQIGDSAGNRIGIPLSVHIDYMPFWNPVTVARMGKTAFIDMAAMHLEKYLKRYPQQHAVFIFELIQGEGGFNVGDRDYFLELIKLCKAHNVAVWDDEIQTFGRSEHMFAYEQFDIGEHVDLFCVGKMTQACATLFTEEYNPKPGLLSGTFSGESVSFRVGERILERLEGGDFYGPQGRFRQHHEKFREEVSKLAQKHPDWFETNEALPEVAGGIGGMMRFSPFGGKRDAIVGACKAIYEEGAVVFWCGHDPYHIRLLPPLPAMSLEEWPRIFEVLERGLQRYVSSKAP